MEQIGRIFAFSWEISLMQWLQSHLGGAITHFITYFSLLGEELVMILLIGVLYWGIHKKMGKYVGLNVLMGVVFCPMIKNIVLRRRPYFDNEGIKILRPVDPDADIYDIAAQGYSFPSGHSANAATAYGSAAFLLNADKKSADVPAGKSVPGRHLSPLSVLAPVLMLLVGFSRVCVGAHYPTDVLAGFFIGGAVILLSHTLRAKLGDSWKLYLPLLVITLPGILYCRSSDYFTGIGMLAGFMAGTLFEEKYVHFEETRRVPAVILRVVAGIAVYVGLNMLLKLPFSAAFLDSSTMGAFLVRALRYMIIAFIEFGIYPMLFSKISLFR